MATEPGHQKKKHTTNPRKKETDTCAIARGQLWEVQLRAESCRDQCKNGTYLMTGAHSYFPLSAVQSSEKEHMNKCKNDT